MQIKGGEKGGRRNASVKTACCILYLLTNRKQLLQRGEGFGQISERKQANADRNAADVCYVHLCLWRLSEHDTLSKQTCFIKSNNQTPTFLSDSEFEMEQNRMKNVTMQWKEWLLSMCVCVCLSMHAFHAYAFNVNRAVWLIFT